MSTSDKLIFAVNEKVIAVNNPDPEVTLLYYLRYTLGLRGTKLGCGEGGCGACTVMLSQYDAQLKTVKHFSVYACITSICKIHLMNVTTVEGKLFVSAVLIYLGQGWAHFSTRGPLFCS